MFCIRLHPRWLRPNHPPLDDADRPVAVVRLIQAVTSPRRCTPSTSRADQLGLPVDAGLLAAATRVKMTKNMFLPDSEHPTPARALMNAQASLLALARAKVDQGRTDDELRYGLRQWTEPKLDALRKQFVGSIQAIVAIDRATELTPTGNLIHRSLAHLLAVGQAEERRRRGDAAPARLVQAPETH